MKPTQHSRSHASASRRSWREFLSSQFRPFAGDNQRRNVSFEVGMLVFIDGSDRGAEAPALLVQIGYISCGTALAVGVGPRWRHRPPKRPVTMRLNGRRRPAFAHCNRQTNVITV